MTYFLLLAALAAAPAGAGAPVAVEDADCVKPALLDHPDITAAQMGETMKHAREYVTCMAAVIEIQRKLANETLEQAKAAAEKNNAMVNEVNAFVADVKAYEEKYSNG